jgi:gliding motility-associated lipoprotein GldH
MSWKKRKSKFSISYEKGQHHLNSFACCIFVKNHHLKNWLCILLIVFAGVGCRQLDVYEQLKSFPSHNWASADSCQFTFTITDTTVRYHIYAIIRHEDAYHYNNIWLGITTQAPKDTVKKQSVMLTLGDNKKGWLGTGMSDVFEHRVRITRYPVQLQKGEYNFVLKQIMREDPLQGLLQAGLRVEKAVP